jgi:hypothetical protein
MLRLAIFLLLPLVITGLVVFAPLWNGALAPSQQERAITIRMTLFTWIIGAVLAFALLLLPNKQRVLMLVPVFVAAMMLGKLWKRARLRARQQTANPGDPLDRMKRVKTPVD